MRLDVLYVIDRLGETDGSAVIDALDDAYGERVQSATAYRGLDALVESGYITKGSVGHRTNSYELTEEGKNALEADRKWRTQE